MEKKVTKAQSDLWKAFMEEINDDELQLRYDNFVDTCEKLKEKYNQMVDVFNRKASYHSSLKELIVESVLLKKSSETLDSLATIFAGITDELQEMSKELESLKERIEEQANLAKKYKETTDDRFFVWYKALKAVKHPDVKNYPDFKWQWKGKII